MTSAFIAKTAAPRISEEAATAFFKKILPPMNNEMYKGQAGRIGIVGGCAEYTGAPFFAAMTALRMGADLCHVFTQKEAATVIKGYSPDLIVHPVIPTDPSQVKDAISSIQNVLDRLHVLLIGPGLGRSQPSQLFASELLKMAKWPIVVDADGLFLLSKDPTLFIGQSMVITPNEAEFGRLMDSLNLTRSSDTGDAVKKLAEVSRVVVLKKGAVDLASYGNEVYVIQESSALRRCGGQGDLLAGALATFLAWANSYDQRHGVVPLKRGFVDPTEQCQCALLASKFVRRLSRSTFELKGRGMLASDMVDRVNEEFAKFEREMM